MSMMTPSEVERVARTAAKEAVVEVLLVLGIDTRDPIKAQATSAAVRDMAEVYMTEDYQKDMLHLRTWRTNMEAATNKGIITLVGLIVAGMASIVVMGVKGWVKGIGGA